MARLLNSLQAELVTAGIARVPSTAGSLPPFFLAPARGVKAPGEDMDSPESHATTVAGGYVTGGATPPPLGWWSMWQNVEVTIRTTKGFQAEDLEQAITLRLLARWGGGISTNPPLLGGVLPVIECQQILPLQMLAQDPGQGFTHLTTYSFQLYRPGA